MQSTGRWGRYATPNARRTRHGRLSQLWSDSKSGKRWRWVQTRSRALVRQKWPWGFASAGRCRMPCVTLCTSRNHTMKLLQQISLHWQSGMRASSQPAHRCVHPFHGWVLVACMVCCKRGDGRHTLMAHHACSCQHAVLLSLLPALLARGLRLLLLLGGMTARRLSLHELLCSMQGAASVASG
jgi:hypothetical protein